MNTTPIKSKSKSNDKDTTESITLMLKDLRLPTARRCFMELHEKGLDLGWSPMKWFSAVLELEVIERSDRRMESRRDESGLPLGKTIETFDFNAIQGVRLEQIESFAQGGSWISDARNLLLFGPSGSGKTHLSAAIGHGLIDHGFRVYYSQTSMILQRMEQARRDARLPEWFRKMERYDVIILDDIGYADKTKVDTGLLFELIADRYESRSLIVASNKPFSLWDDVFPDNARCIAAIDRLVHHGSILELQGESYRRRTAAGSKTNPKLNKKKPTAPSIPQTT